MEFWGKVDSHIGSITKEHVPLQKEAIALGWKDSKLYLDGKLFYAQSTPSQGEVQSSGSKTQWLHN